MSRSLKKGPYIDQKLLKRIVQMNRTGEKRVIKTWARRSTISPEFVGHTLAIHNGNKFGFGIKTGIGSVQSLLVC